MGEREALRICGPDKSTLETLAGTSHSADGEMLPVPDQSHTAGTRGSSHKGCLGKVCSYWRSHDALMIPAGKWAFISLPLGLPRMSLVPKHMSMFSHVDIHLSIKSTGWGTGRNSLHYYPAGFL